MDYTIIYLDLIIMFDFLINLIFLWFIEKLYDEKIKLMKLIFVSFIGSLLVLPAFFNAKYLNFIKILCGIIIILLLCFSDEKSKIIIKISLFYTLNFALVGVLSTFKITKWYYFFCGLLLILILIIFENYRKYFIFIKENEYNVIIKGDKGLINIKGLLDTGNLSSYLGYPIIYINKKYQIDIENNKKVFINLETVNGNRIVEGYIYKDLLYKVKNKEYYKDVIVVISDISVDCLLNPMLML